MKNQDICGGTFQGLPHLIGMLERQSALEQLRQLVKRLEAEKALERDAPDIPCVESPPQS